MVLEATREDAAAAAVQGRCYRVAGTRHNRLAIKLESDILRAVRHHSGKNASNTSLVVVLRRACSHWRQPERWYHHSRCTPESLALVYVYSIHSAAGASGSGRFFTSPPNRHS